jgi:hypothetical protein
MTIVAASRPRPAMSGILWALIEPARPAALVQWGVLVLVFFTSPIQPYTDGTWGLVTLGGLAGLGALAAMVGRGPTGIAGCIVAFTAAVAIQLFVLGGQAEANIGVVADLTEPPWSARVMVALAIGLATLLAGYLLVAGSRAVIDRRLIGATAPAALPRRMALVAGVLVASAFGVWVLVGSIASSAYLLPSDQPVLALEVSGDEIVSEPPAGVIVGRSVLKVRRTQDGVGAIGITAALTTEDRADLESGRLHLDRLGEVFIGGTTGIRDERRAVQFVAPGIYAFIVWDEEQQPDAAELVTVLDAQTFEVSAPASTPTAPADGGLPVRAGGLFGVLMGAWSAAGSTLMTRRRRWVDRGRPTARDASIAAAVGTGAALLLAFLALAAIDLARNPF